MRKSLLNGASAMLGVPVDSWSSPVKYLFTGERPKEALAEFIQEINKENAEFMSYDKEFNSVDLNPSYEQLPQDRIDDQCNKNIMMLKSFELILDGRLIAFNKFLDYLSKTRTSFDVFQSSEGTLRQALDALFVFVEQELQQARQQLSLGDLRKDLIETKNDALKRASDYQKEIAAAEADVANAEKNLSKTKEHVRKLLVQKRRMEIGYHSSESLGNNYFRNSVSTPPPSPAITSSVSESGVGSPHNMPEVRSPSTHDLEKNEKYQENKEQLDKAESEVRHDIRELLRLIGIRDQVLAASRRALQQLNRQCKTTLSGILRKIVDREREALAARSMVVDKLDKAVENLSCEEDEQEFIDCYKVQDSGELIQCSRALSILGDIVTIDKISKKDNEMEANDDGLSQPRLVRRVSGGTDPAICTMEETTMHLSKIFYLTEWPHEIIAQDASVEDVLNAFLANIELADNEQNSGVILRNSVQKLVKLSDKLEGRKILVTVLNQFRSKQVNVGAGFKILAAVLWSLLTKCKNSNDVHNGKVVMMLSQTFYVLTFDTIEKSATVKVDEDTTCDNDEDIDNLQSKCDNSIDATSIPSIQKSDDCGSSQEREDGGARRMYLKELLISHPLWLDGRFWEQALWQCVLEQLMLVQFDEKWHDMVPGDRMDAVRNVHDVIFSQVMAIAHSMMELGCDKTSTREFVYRMSVVHQLSERQLHELLLHLNSHSSDS